MLPGFLFPEGVASEDGNGPAVVLGPAQAKSLLITLGITRILEQESLDLAVWGSVDGSDWGAKPLIAFPQKFYCGTYSLVLDLSAHPEVAHVRIAWKMGRWGRGDPKPMFGFFVFAEEALTAVLAAV
jgi:hypothetical protein